MIDDHLVDRNTFPLLRKAAFRIEKCNRHGFDPVPVTVEPLNNERCAVLDRRRRQQPWPAPLLQVIAAAHDDNASGHGRQFVDPLGGGISAALILYSPSSMKIRVLNGNNQQLSEEISLEADRVTELDVDLQSSQYALVSAYDAANQAEKPLLYILKDSYVTTAAFPASQE